MSEILVNSLKTAGGVGSLTFDSTGDVLLTTGRLGRLGGSAIEIDSSGQFVGTNAFTGAVTIGGDLTVDSDSLYVNSTNGHIGFGTTSPGSSNGAIGKVVGVSSSVNNVLSGETTGGAGYSGWIIEARQDGRSGNERFSQIVMNTDGSNNGQMIFQNAVASADVTESIRVTSSGISFDAGSNFLDDYEEGAWTATYGASGSDPGVYIKTGNLVFAKATLRDTSQTFSTVTGLPFSGTENNIGGIVGRIIGFSGFDRSNLGVELQSGSTGGLLTAGGGAATVTSGTGTVRLDLTWIYTTI